MHYLHHIFNKFKSIFKHSDNLIFSKTFNVFFHFHLNAQIETCT